MEPWFKKYGERYTQEIQDLEKYGIRYTINEELKAQDILRLDLEIDGSNKIFELPRQYETTMIRLIAVFPDLYPYFRPDVYAPDLSLPRHQNPFMKNLCLIPRESRFWDVEITLAKLLVDQLRQVLTKGNITDADAIKADETEQAEPWSEYYSVQHQNPIIFDPTCFQTDFASGKIEYLGEIQVSTGRDTALPSKMIVSESFSPDGKSISKLPDSFTNMFVKKMVGGIYSVPKAPPNDDALQTIGWITEQLNAVGKNLKIPRSAAVKGDMTIKNVIGITFPEEIEPGIEGQGWLFVIHLQVPFFITVKNRQIRQSKEAAYFAKIARIDKKSLGVRVPKLANLKDKTISIIGLGAIGAPTAIEFAKAGVKELRILDHDVVEAATTVRWPLGLMYAGEFKVEALKKFINENYPTTEVKTFAHKIGLQRHIPNMDATNNGFEHLYLNDVFEGTSLIFDATAEMGVMQYLSEEANRRKIPFVSAYATEGAVGGVVMRVVPDKTEGCWMCLQYKFDEKEISLPPFDESGKVQPIGCGDLSFTGTSFDLANIYIAGVRLAVSTLTEDTENGYPSLNWDVGILSLIDNEKLPIAPTWVTHKLTKHAKCTYCGK